MSYDVVFIGNYTKDTIVSPTGTRVVDGGGFNYGAHVAAMMGLKTAAVTRLAAADRHVVEALERVKVTVLATYAPHSTCLTLYYPGQDPDRRVITLKQSAGSFTPEQVRLLTARAFVINGSIRGEVGLEVIAELRRKEAMLAADVQGFLRVPGPDGELKAAPWPERDEVLAVLDILKADAVEAAALTGESDLARAARRLAGWGPKEVVLTDREGVLVWAEGRIRTERFRPRQMVGRSGRGDTCIAAYVCARLSWPPEEATRWAAAVTSLKLEAEGPLGCSRQQVEALLREAYSG